MKATEKRDCTFDVYEDGSYTASTTRVALTPTQAAKIAETIAKNYARGTFRHIQVFVKAGELAIADITARTVQDVSTSYRKRIELNTQTYNIQ